jgi:hypothetical protein
MWSQNSLKLLMQFAVQQHATQFILLTPLSMGSIKDAAKKVTEALPGNDWPEPDFMRIRLIQAANRIGMQSQAVPE